MRLVHADPLGPRTTEAYAERPVLATQVPLSATMNTRAPSIQASQEGPSGRTTVHTTTKDPTRATARATR